MLICHFFFNELESFLSRFIMLQPQSLISIIWNVFQFDFEMYFNYDFFNFFLV